ncbi:Alanine racemase 1 [Fusobacterium necrophorum subsp. funduliforme]|uniref:alanine racemase n=1 Tax=Fusobacterium necrophorum TaxID=859 RepID=UPI000460A94C|nr:alanine racemase [Fusobacterium necrophorum]KDE74350.1 alanine racemase [Fusobacterium necrophorum BFTR-2]MBR8722688.1 Alanine racemase 1 [Fusobacterium necrophorum subsp. funduliforme]
MRAWVEIDTEHLRHNIREIQKRAEGLEVCGVIKANAYGLGVLPVTKILEEEGIHFFAVASLEEAKEVRSAGIAGEILILGSLFHEEILEAEEAGFHINVSSREELEWISQHAPKVKIHIKIDTGMTRLGFSYQEGRDILAFAKQLSLQISGIFSHFSDADGISQEARKYTETQIERFLPYANQKDIPYRHIFNSGALVQHRNQKIGNMVRAGICMYGILGSTPIPDFKNVVTLKTKVLFKKKVEEDTYVSYGRLYCLKQGETYVTLPIGYADGVKKYLANGGKVEILGELCPIIGAICMDMMMVKIPENLEDKIKIGTEVIVWNNEIIEKNNIPETCTWDMFTALGRRVQRIYK